MTRHKAQFNRGSGNAEFKVGGAEHLYSMPRLSAHTSTEEGELGWGNGRFGAEADRRHDQLAEQIIRASEETPDAAFCDQLRTVIDEHTRFLIRPTGTECGP